MEAEAEAIKKYWKRKRVNFRVVKAEAEAASSKKLEAEAEALHVEAEAIKNSPLPHHCEIHIVYVYFKTR